MVEKTEHPIAVMLINCTEEKQVSMTACVCDVCFFCAFRSLGHVMQLCFLSSKQQHCSAGDTITVSDGLSDRGVCHHMQEESAN